MNKYIVFSLSLFGSFGLIAKNAAAISDYVINGIDKATKYVEQVGQVQEDISSKMHEYMNIKVGVPGDAKQVQKATERAERIKTKVEKYQAKAEQMKKKMDKAKGKIAAVKAEKDKLQAKADEIKAEYQQAQEKVKQAKAKIAEAKAKVDGKINEAKQLYEDVKGKVDEVKTGLNDIKEGAAALKDVAQSKLDEVRAKIPGQDDDGINENQKIKFSEKSKIVAEEQTKNIMGTVDMMTLVPERKTVSKADTLSVLNTILQEDSIQTEIVPDVAVSDALPMTQMLTPDEVVQKAEGIKLDSPEKAEYTSPFDLQEQLKRFDAAKAKESSEKTLKHINQEEFRGRFKAEGNAKQEVLQVSRRGTSRKSFEQTLPNQKGEADVR